MAKRDETLDALEYLVEIGILGEGRTDEMGVRHWPVLKPEDLTEGWLKNNYQQFGEVRWSGN